MHCELISENASFGGVHRRYRHQSSVLNCEMVFAVYLPPQALAGETVPALYWLSGLTCTDENFMQKAGAQRGAAAHGIALIGPDTSPRGAQVPTDPDGATDFGFGAGFYINATQAPWAQHYQMHDYVVHELPALVEATLPVSTTRSISGHSMGGHGALICALRNPGIYRSVSALAPISNPSCTVSGRKALSRFLGDDESVWADWDASRLLARVKEKMPLLVDQGTSDPFLERSMMPEKLIAAAQANDHPLNLRMRPGYDHSYYFVASFIDEHLAYHAAALHAI